MHCGIGELYFAMTNSDPKNLEEDEVIELAVKMSPLPEKQQLLHSAEKAKYAELKATIRKLKLKNNDLDVDLYDRLDRAEDDLNDEDDLSEEFTRSLEEVMNVNDDDYGTSPAKYKARAKRVAEQFRVAAKLLPVK